MSVEKVHELAEMLGGKVESMDLLPDGYGCATVSYPLPKDHWIYGQKDDIYDAPPMPLRTGTASPLREPLAAAIREAAQYAVRSATMNGTEMDFDPDALVQNMVTGMLGYWTPDGLASTDDWANPPIYRKGKEE